jgi:hypothetical protein
MKDSVGSRVSTFCDDPQVRVEWSPVRYRVVVDQLLVRVPASQESELGDLARIAAVAAFLVRTAVVVSHLQ